MEAPAEIFKDTVRRLQETMRKGDGSGSAANIQKPSVLCDFSSLYYISHSAALTHTGIQ